MIGLDTNVVVRYLTQDDPRQCRVVNDLFERAVVTFDKKAGAVSGFSLLPARR